MYSRSSLLLLTKRGAKGTRSLCGRFGFESSLSATLRLFGNLLGRDIEPLMYLDGFFTAGGTLFNESTNGFIGGGQVGYNWQFRHAVVGIETDFQYLSNSQNTTLFALPPGNVGPTFHDSVQWLGTVRGRAGLAIDDVLTYVTAGLAYGRARHTIVDQFFNVNPNFDLSSTKVGFTAGAGAEYALDPRWSVKAEVLYVDLGKNSATITGTAQSTPPGNPTTATGRFDINDTMWIVRAGVNYKFGG